MTEQDQTDNLSYVWSESYKRILWRRVWCAVATAQMEVGLVTLAQWRDLVEHRYDIDVQASMEIEKETRHDLMAEIKLYARQAPIAGPIIHLGMTSSDVEESADILRIKQSLRIVYDQLLSLLGTMGVQRSVQLRLDLADLKPMLKADVEAISDISNRLRTKGLKGAVGTSSSYTQLLLGTRFTAQHLERMVMEELGLDPLPVASQIGTRKQDVLVFNTLSGLHITLQHLGKVLTKHDLLTHGQEYILRNNASSVNRMSIVAWDNAAHSLMERTLDDSANRRYILPTSFINTQESIGILYLAMKGHE